MTVITIAQNTSVLVAIDIAKARHEVLIAVPGKKRRRRLTVLNTLADFTVSVRCPCSDGAGDGAVVSTIDS